MARRSHRGNLLIGITTTWILLGCAPRAMGRAAEAEVQPFEITILHTNDIHGKFKANQAPISKDPEIGGFANLSAHVRHVRSQAERALLLDAGDLMTGNPICEYEYKGVRGGALIEFMNLVGYDAMALGHHEFDLGPRNLDGLMELARFPVLCANTWRPNGRLRANEAFQIFELRGLRVGVIGLMTEDLHGIVARSSLAGTKVRAAAAAAREIVREIDSRTDLIVLLTHVGLEEDRRLAKKVKGIDVIIGAHSHTELKKPLVENGVIIVQAGAHNEKLGRLQLTVADDRVTAFDGSLIELDPLESVDPEVEHLVEEYTRRIDNDYGRVIGRLATPWRSSRNRESTVGNWLCDRLREATGADFAIYNSGGIRKDIEAGPITRLDVFELLPFANLVAKFECTGEQLALLVETNARAAVEGAHSILQVSGIRYTYASDGDRVRIRTISVDGRALDPKKVYVGATVDYVIYSNPARYMGFNPRNKSVEGSLFSDLIVRAIERSSRPIAARIDHRIRALQE